MNTRGRLTLVLGLIVLCTAAHFMVPHHYHELHEWLFKVTYVPIILAGLWFGVKGGLATSVAVSIIYIVHVQYQLGGHLLTNNLGRTLDIALYNLIAAVTGGLSLMQLRARRRAEALAQEQASLRRELEESYTALRRQTEELFRTEEQLRQAERLAALGELTAGIAHEIRTPVSSLCGAAEILCRPDVSAEAREEFGQILLRESNRLNRVVRNILHFTQTQRAEMTETDVGAVVQHVIDLVRPAATHAHVAVTGNVQPRLRARTDPQLLEHILVNLALNAVEALSEGGQVVLAASASGGMLRLMVRDNGPGVPPEAQERIFEPFYTTKTRGTGLGLSIARRIAHALGGELRLSSVEGQGAEFSVELPLDTSKEEVDLNGSPQERVDR